MLKFFCFCLVFLAPLLSDSIPCVDLRDYYTPQKRAAFLEKVNDALQEYGFFSVVNTGIDEELTKRTYDLSRWFFAKPIDEKRRLNGMHTNCQRGYVPFGLETAKGRTLADCKEFYHIGQEFDAQKLTELKYWPNIWPKESHFRAGCLEFRRHLVDFSVLIERILAESLKVDDTFFSSKTKDGDTVLRLIHYPATKSSDKVGDNWAAEHTDIDLFTILPVATSNGLEVQTRSGRWVRAQTLKNSFIVNAGDFLEIFTNGLYRSSVHRVRRCADNQDRDRYSMVMFVHPRADVWLDPLECCVKKTGGKKLFASATRYEMLMERLTDLGQASDQMLKELSASGVMERLIAVGRASTDCMLELRKRGYASSAVLEELARLGL
jgi:isopenicillin N synthase-like dioxygenase